MREAIDMAVHFRVVSANLRNGRADAVAFARLAAGLEADVAAVQELAPEQADALAALMPLGKLEPARNHTGMGIALRDGGPVRPGAVWRLPLPGRDAWIAELAPPGAPAGAEPIELVNVHIRAPHILPLRVTRALRRGQLAGLLDHLDGVPRRRRAVIGDLNATPLWPLYRRLATRLADAATEVARWRGTRPQRTWGPWAGGPRLLRIDHVLLGGLAARDVRTVPIDGSDHDALVIDLTAEA